MGCSGRGPLGRACACGVRGGAPLRADRAPGGELDEKRALRLLEVREGIPSILWVVLILGGATTLCFTYLLGVSTEWLHVFMIVAYTLVLALVLVTIGAMDYPFNGIAQVSPDAFEDAPSRMESYRGR